MFGVGDTKRAAEEAVRLAEERGVSLDFSRSSVVALDELLLDVSRSAARQGSTDDEIWDLACIYGSYLGECMLRNDFGRLGFAWGEDTDGEPCLKPTSKATGSAASLSRFVPITKAYKRLVNGEQDSAAQFYAMTLLMVSDDDCSKALGELGQESMPVEPKYVGANGNVSASAAAWLFCEDVVFFSDEQIAWDGRCHSALGMQINAEKIYSAPALLSSYQTILPGVMDLISNIERDEGLRVPLGIITRAFIACCETKTSRVSRSSTSWPVRMRSSLRRPLPTSTRWSATAVCLLASRASISWWRAWSGTCVRTMVVRLPVRSVLPTRAISTPTCC